MNKLKTILAMNKHTLIVLIFPFLLCHCAEDNKEGIDGNNTDYHLIIKQTAFLPKVEDTYIYPVIDEVDWGDLGSFEEFEKTLTQLPDSVIKNISTPGLIRSFLDAPSLSAFYLSSSDSRPKVTWDRIFLRYNSFQELIKRKDTGKALLYFYNAVSLDSVKRINDGRYLELSIQHNALEFLFTQSAILKQFSHKEKQKLVSSLLLRYADIQDIGREEFDGSTSIIVTAYVLYDDKYAPIVEYASNNKQFESIIQGGYLYSSEEKDDIISLAKKYTN
jgi:hypothetical protein